MRSLSDSSTDLKKILAEKIPKHLEVVKKFRKEHGSAVVGEVTVDMVCNPYIILFDKIVKYNNIYNILQKRIMY